MSAEDLAVLIAKDEVRELALLYSRGVDRKDAALLRSLYTKDATDTHGDTFDGSAEDFIRLLEGAFPRLSYTGHHICNHMISVNGDEGEGEVYAIAYHHLAGRDGEWVENIVCARYIDRYRKEEGRWRFAQRVVTYDYRSMRPVEAPKTDAPGTDASYTTLKSRLFKRGVRP